MATFNAVLLSRWLDAWPVAFRRAASRRFRLEILPLGNAARLRLCWDKKRTARWWAEKAIAHEDHGNGWPSTIGHHHHVIALARAGVRSVTLMVSGNIVWDGNHRLVAALVQRGQGKAAPTHVGVFREVRRKR